jgi:mannitol-specific phosphotransferase system IIBC component
MWLLGNGDCDTSSATPTCICSAQYFGAECKESLTSVPVDAQAENPGGVFAVDSSISFPIGYLAAIFVGVAIAAVVSVIVAYHIRSTKYRRLLQSQLSGSSKSNISLDESTSSSL